MNWRTTLLTSVGILLLAGLVTTLVFSTEPTAERTGASRETAMLVDVISVSRDTVRPTLRAMGTVRPSQEVTLRPRVSGQVVDRADSFTPGGYVREGTTVLQIDPADYKNALQQRRSELQQAEADLKLEMGRQDVARRDYQLLEDSLSGENRALVLRKPQLNAARSEVESARAAVDQAELNLQRTSIRAPFDAHIVRRNVNVGSQVDSGDELGRLVGFDEYWVEATVPVSKLPWLQFTEENGRGSAVRVVNRTAWDEGVSRQGYLYRLVGALEDQTRMARVLVSVPDPHGRAEDTTGPRLILGSYVELRMDGKVLNDVVRLDRDYVRDDETVWVMADQALQIRDVDVAVQDAKYAYIRSGLEDGDQVVTTNLSTVTDGAPLRLRGSESESLPDPAQEE